MDKSDRIYRHSIQEESTMRKSYTAEFKAKVALEATKGDKPLFEIASKYDVHPNQVGQWKKNCLITLFQLISKIIGCA